MYLTGWSSFLPKIGLAVKYHLLMQTHVQFVIFCMMTPLTLLFFSKASLISPLANILSIPWVSIAVVPLLFLFLVLPYDWDGWALQLANEALFGLMFFLNKMSALPASTFYFEMNAQGGLLALALLLLVMPVAWPGRRYAYLILLMGISGFFPKSDSAQLAMDVLDVGQGGATLFYFITSCLVV